MTSIRLHTSDPRRIAGAVLALLLGAASATAQITFTPVSDIGRIAVNDMIQNEDGDLLVGGPGGSFLRESDLDQWQEIPFEHEIYSFELLSDGTLFAGTARGIHRSTDGGRSWRLVANVADVGDFAVGADGTIMAIPWFGRDHLSGFVYISKDGGNTWSPNSTRFGTLWRNNVVSLGNRFFTGSASGLKVSYNDGDVWETTRLIDSIGALIVTETGTLVAAAGNEEVLTYLWESYDSGTSWTRVDSLPGISALTPIDGDRYLVTVTSRQGAPDEEGEGLWEREAGDEGREMLYGTTGIADLLVDGEEILLAENFRLRRGSTRSGEWTDVTGPIMRVPPGELLTTADGRAYAMIADSLFFERGVPRTEYSLFSSEDNGETWNYHAGSFDPERVIADDVGSVWIVDTYVVWKRDSTGGFRVLDIRNRTLRLDSRDLSVTPFSDAKLLDLASHPSGVIVAIVGDTTGSRRDNDLLFSLDSGSTWSRFSDDGYPFAELDSIPVVRSFTVADDGAVVAAVRGSRLQGTYRFLLQSEGSTTTLGSEQLYPPAIIRMDDGRLLMTSYPTGDGMYRSSDDGRTWEPVAEGQRMISVTPLGEGTLFADLRFMSNDYGDSWFGSEQMRQIVRGRDRALYAINGSATGFRKSVSNGQLWIDAGFRELSGYGRDIAVTTDGTFLVATSEGLFRSVTPSSVPTVGITRNAEGLTLELRGEQIFIRGDVLVPAVTTGAIYDLSGRRVAEIALQRSASTEMTGSIRTTDLPHGTWLLLVRSGSLQASTLFVR